jgi:fucokinase
VSLADYGHVARSRRLRLRADLQHAAGNTAAGKRYAQEAWDAVTSEVASAQSDYHQPQVSGRQPGTVGSCTLAARFDLAGGWSDTPPYCLEHPAKVLNLAIELDGQRPIGAHAEALVEPVWEVALANVEPVRLNAKQIFVDGGLSDPYALPKAACMVMGFGSAAGITQGVRLRCWSRVPKGSGLGSSSILAAAICTALAKVAGADTNPFSICTQVLAVEQALTTRGGWQDQLGGLLPGAKLLSSLPTRPLRIRCDTMSLAPTVVDELQEHLVLAYTGISRLARDVLQRVVSGYLSRDALVVGGIQRLVECAEHGRMLLGNGDLSGIGNLFCEVWRLHQDLDPNCSNPAVDRLLAPVHDWSHGWKLAGAGGGGFVAIMAKDRAAAQKIRTYLTRQAGVRVYRWTLG